MTGLAGLAPAASDGNALEVLGWRGQWLRGSGRETSTKRTRDEEDSA